MSSKTQSAPHAGRGGLGGPESDPLEAIEQAELEAEVLLQEAHRQADEIVEAARAEAARLRAEAAAVGRGEGEAAYGSAMKEARAEAAAITTEATCRIEAVSQAAAARGGPVVDALARKVLGLEADG